MGRTRVSLTGGAYQARSVIASAQRCVNLYPEAVASDAGEPSPATYYQRPGLRLVGQPPNVAGIRGMYLASNGDAYVVVGRQVCYVSPTWAFTVIGTIADRPTPVSMADNGQTIVLVDGTTTGYTINMTSRAFGSINDPAFYGADRVEYLSTFFIFNRPGTNQFYISGSQATTFDPLDIVGKTGGEDKIVSIASIKGELWLIGSLSSEVWQNTGAADFTFQQVSGALIEHGCSAKYSVAVQDVGVFWLSQDRQGKGIVVLGSNYQLKRISTYAIEAAIQSYGRVDDAIGFCFQQQGHSFYVITFPTADVTWSYELASGQWHQLASTDRNGVLRRYRANCAAFLNGQNIAGDWQNGNLYAIDPAIYTDNGLPLTCIRAFPHIMADGRRVAHRRFIADVSVGTTSGTGSSIGADFSVDFAADFATVATAPVSAFPPRLSLRWSDTRGASWGDAVTQSVGKGGEYGTSPQWSPLGYARDRIYELSWSENAQIALNGAFLDLEARPT